MGRMIQIDDFIKELQETRRKFGNTCVYIRDVSWGAVALNRQAEDEAVEHRLHADGATVCPKCNYMANYPICVRCGTPIPRPAGKA